MSTLSVVGQSPDHPASHQESVSEHGRPPVTSDQSIARLVHRHGAVLFGYLLRLTCGDRQRAEDIYQETLIRAWKHPECRVEGGTSSRQWLFTVARRVSIDQLRAAVVRPVPVSDERHLAAVPDPVDQIDRLLLAREVRAAVMTLSPAHRQVLKEMYFEDRSASEVAVRLGIPAGTVKSRTYYALRALKDALAERGMDRCLVQSA